MDLKFNLSKRGVKQFNQFIEILLRNIFHRLVEDVLNWSNQFCSLCNTAEQENAHVRNGPGRVSQFFLSELSQASIWATVEKVLHTMGSTDTYYKSISV